MVEQSEIRTPAKTRKLRSRCAAAAGVLLALLVLSHSAGVYAGEARRAAGEPPRATGEAGRGVGGELTIRQVGAWGGSVNAIHVEQQGDRTIAFIGSGVRFVILDVTDPGAIIELGSVMLDAAINDLQVRDGYAYIGASKTYVDPSVVDAFCVVDVHDVTAPFLVASGIGRGRGDGIYHNVALDGAGRTAYAAPWASMPLAIDITDPTAPVYLGECGGFAAPVFSGSLLYGLDAAGGQVLVSDMSMLPDSCPSGGVWVGSAHIPEFRGAAAPMSALGGNYLYVVASLWSSASDDYSLLFVVDISDPEAPVHVGTWGDPSGETLDLCFDGSGRGVVAVSDGRLYWAGWGRRDPLSRTMVILDVATDPANPQLIGEYSSAAEFGAIEVVGTTVYLGDWREGLIILDCSDPANPVRVGNYLSPREFHQGALDGNMLYMTDPSYGVTMVDVSNSQAPALVGRWETGTYTPDRQHRMTNWGIAVRDGQAYVAAGYGGFQVLDVSDPAAPTLAGEFSPWPAGAMSVGLELSPDEPIVHVGYVSPGSGTWIVNFDVSNPSNVVDVGAVNIGSYWTRPHTIDRGSDGVAYATRDNALVTLDLTSAEAPLMLGRMGYDSVAGDLAVDGNYLYAVNDTGFGAGYAGLDVFSVSGADHLPVHEAHHDFDHSAPKCYSVAVSEELAYVGGPQFEMRVLDVRDPASAVPVGRTSSAGANISDLIVDGPMVYAITRSHSGDAGAGVLVYQVFSLGDFDDDGDVDLDDSDSFMACFTGPDGGPVGPGCEPGDFDSDRDIDCVDWDSFVDAWTGPGDPPVLTGCSAVVSPALPAGPPHDTRKNRYISFDPGNTEPVAFQVELSSMKRCSDDLGRTCRTDEDCPPQTGSCTEHPQVGSVVGWVGEPDGNDVSRVVGAPVYRVWSESTVHVSDCAIIPVTTYGLRATADGVVFTAPLEVGTIRKPGIWHYGDVVGEGTADLPPLPGFTPPNLVVNITDVQALVLSIRGPSSPSAHTTWVDLHGLGDGAPPNFILNVSDVLRVLWGMGGQRYLDSPEHLAPGDCP